MRNSSTKNNWRSTAMVAGAILTAGAVTITTTEQAHADNNQNNAQVSTNQATYNQVKATADQQLAQLQSANSDKEAQVATANEQANAADSAQMAAQVNQLQASHDALVQQQASAVAQAQADAATKIEAQTSAANANYQQQLDAQQQKEAQLKSANDQQYAQAVSEAAKAQSAVSGVQSQYQQALSEATQAQSAANTSATNEYNDAVAKENAAYNAQKSAQEATNNNQISQAQAQLSAATQNAQQVRTENVSSQVTVNGRVAKSLANFNVLDYAKNYGIHLEVAGFSNGIPASAYQYQIFANTYYGEYPDSSVITTKDESATPHDISELPLDFQPGLLIYDADNDHSETVSADGLSAAQIQVLRALATSWANGFRNYVYQNYRAYYNAVNSSNGFKDVQPQELLETNLSDQYADQVVKARTDYGIDNNSHSITSSGLPADKTYSAFIANIFNGLQNNLENQYAGSVVYSLNSENLTTVQAKKLTLLNYAVNLYNSMQGMYYGELVSPEHIGGHAANILRGDVSLVGTGFQKLSNAIVNKSGSGISDKQNPSYAVTFDLKGFNINHDATKTQTIQKNVWGTSTIDSQLNAIKGAQHYTKTVTKTEQVQPSAAEVQQATASQRQNLANVQAQAQQALDSLASAHQTKLDQLNKQYVAAQDQVKADYAQAIKQAASDRDNALSKLGVPDLATVKVQLDAAYQQLVEADQKAAQELAIKREATINAAKGKIQAELNNKLAELIPSIQPQLDALQKEYQKNVDYRNTKLAMLKEEDTAAYNKLAQELATQLAEIQQNSQQSVHLGNATAVLPQDNQNDGSGVNKVAQAVTFTGVANNNQQATSQQGNANTVATSNRVSVANAHATVARQQTPVTATAVATNAINATMSAANSLVAPVATTNLATANNGNGTTASTSNTNLTANNQATKLAGSKKATKNSSKTTAKKNDVKKAQVNQKLDKSSMSITALAGAALVGALGITYSSKKRHN